MKFLFNQLTAALVLPPLWMMGGHPAHAEQQQATTSLGLYREGFEAGRAYQEQNCNKRIERNVKFLADENAQLKRQVLKQEQLKGKNDD